ncbi:hypothetical protein E2C01_065961 [Portunus trituberculatus]|uniref:Uncharacterized protein n=1 Tax=Portunus trituberculatus TaxID=210409 RepID=A0A5B7HP03_PORTR|nr:hypothetical protein [Portunus trituberculatus]
MARMKWTVLQLLGSCPQLCGS